MVFKFISDNKIRLEQINSLDMLSYTAIPFFGYELLENDYNLGIYGETKRKKAYFYVPKNRPDKLRKGTYIEREGNLLRVDFRKK